MLVTVNQEFLEDSEAEKKWLSHSQRQTALYVSKVREENARLRGLLKEVKEFIEEENPKDFTIMSERMNDLLTKINPIIGESEE